ncbi:MAG: glycerol-3-phosphate dehydrogenase C-terminal domain-containing protein, partial [Orrella sp.]
PKPFKEELDFILHEAARHLQRAPGHQDIRSLWVGLRPLVKPADSHHHSQATKRISREHTIVTSASGMVTVTGGKWTTYRVMAHDTLAHCFKEGLLAKKGMDQTAELLLVGAQTQGPVTHKMSDAPGLAQYGDEQSHVQSMTGVRHMLAAGLSEAMVRFAARYEYARTVEDVLARRHRLLFLDAAAAQRLAPVVGEILQSETGQDPQTEAFVTLAQQYQTLPV